MLGSRCSVGHRVSEAPRHPGFPLHSDREVEKRQTQTSMIEVRFLTPPLFLLCLVLTGVGSAREKRDVIQFTNGGRITCVSLKLRLAKDLYSTFGYYLNYDSRPPQNCPKSD